MIFRNPAKFFKNFFRILPGVSPNEGNRNLFRLLPNESLPLSAGKKPEVCSSLKILAFIQ
jgi:hypothetical protein